MERARKKPIRNLAKSPMDNYPRVLFTTKATTAMIKKTTNNIFAIPVALAAIPVNPSNAAINAIIKKTIA